LRRPPRQMQFCLHFARWGVKLTVGHLQPRPLPTPYTALPFPFHQQLIIWAWPWRVMRFDNCVPVEKGKIQLNICMYIHIYIYIYIRQHCSHRCTIKSCQNFTLPKAPFARFARLLCFPPLSSTPIAFWLSLHLHNSAPILKSFSHTTASHLGPEMFMAKRNQRPRTRTCTQILQYTMIMKFSTPLPPPTSPPDPAVHIYRCTWV